MLLNVYVASLAGVWTPCHSVSSGRAVSLRLQTSPTPYVTSWCGASHSWPSNEMPTSLSSQRGHRGHARRFRRLPSVWYLNWLEILKNIVFFIFKSFLLIPWWWSFTIQTSVARFKRTIPTSRRPPKRINRLIISVLHCLLFRPIAAILALINSNGQ